MNWSKVLLVWILVICKYNSDLNLLVLGTYTFRPVCIKGIRLFINKWSRSVHKLVLVTSCNNIFTNVPGSLLLWISWKWISWNCVCIVWSEYYFILLPFWVNIIKVIFHEMLQYFISFNHFLTFFFQFLFHLYIDHFNHFLNFLRLGILTEILTNYRFFQWNNLI